MQFVEQILNLRTTNNLTDATVKDLLKLISYYEENRDKVLVIPSSNYKLEQYSKFDLDSKYGFVAPCCNTKFLMRKEEIDYCPNCREKLSKREIMISPETFLQYNLRTQLTSLLNKFDLMKEEFSDKIDTFFDCENFQNFKSSKEEGSLIVILDLNSDGFDLTKEHDLRPLFFNVLNLNAPIETKIILNSVFKATSKPDVDFYLDGLVDTLNEFSREGLYIEKYSKKVYIFFALLSLMYQQEHVFYRIAIVKANSAVLFV